MPALVSIKHGLEADLPEFPARGALLSVGAVILGLVGLFAAQLAGMVWLSRRQDRGLDDGRIWLLSLFGAGLVALLVLSASGTGNQLYFAFYGLIAGCLLSAEGIRIGWLRRPRDTRYLIPVALMGAAWLVMLAALIAAPLDEGLFSGPEALAHNLMFWYGGLLLALLLLFLAARKALARHGGPRWRSFAAPYWPSALSTPP